ncbi:MAG TPA: hypothetical protein GXX19_01415 [Syntrophomonadaceae bacterium]|nr:hypothetical protein [Syntrophomonadaceae bacterium]
MRIRYQPGGVDLRVKPGGIRTAWLEEGEACPAVRQGRPLRAGLHA